jgi:hypothetical protein
MESSAQRLSRLKQESRALADSHRAAADRRSLILLLKKPFDVFRRHDSDSA